MGVVTGASAGVGRATALAIAAQLVLEQPLELGPAATLGRRLLLKSVV